MATETKIKQLKEVSILWKGADFVLIYTQFVDRLGLGWSKRNWTLSLIWKKRPILEVNLWLQLESKMSLFCFCLGHSQKYNSKNLPQELRFAVRLSENCGYVVVLNGSW